MPLLGFDDLYRRADAERPAVGIAAAGAADPTVLEALRQGCDRGWVTPFLSGPESEIRRLADDRGIDLHE